MPTATHPEILDVIRIAADRKATVFVHMRSPGAIEPGSVTESLQEMIADAAITGASIHVVHITSMASGQTGLMLEMIAGARKRGHRHHHRSVSVHRRRNRGSIPRCSIGGWQEQLGDHIQGSAMGRHGRAPHRRDFAKYRKDGGFVILHSIPEEAARQAMADPGVIIASDGMIYQWQRPSARSAGTYARVLGHYVARRESADR